MERDVAMTLRGNGKFLVLYALLGPLVVPLLLQPHDAADYLRVVGLALPPMTVWMAVERVVLYRKIYCWWEEHDESLRYRVRPSVVWAQPFAKACLSIPAIALVITRFNEPLAWYSLPALVAAECAAAFAEWHILASLRRQLADLQRR